MKVDYANANKVNLDEKFSKISIAMINELNMATTSMETFEM
jgi:hypothetical protein